MSTATCTPEVRGPSVGGNEVSGEANSVTSRVETAGDGASETGRSPGSARQDEVGQDANPAAARETGSESCPKKTADKRDAKGRFGPGNIGGPGNPFARQLAKFRAFVMNCNTEEHMTLAFNKMMELIADGNLGALKLYFLYILGKPADAVDPDKLDLEEWNGYKATAGMVEEATALMKAPASDLPLTLLRIGKAAVTQKMRDFAAYNIEHPEEMQKAKAEAARKKKEELEKVRKMLDEVPTVVGPELPAVVTARAPSSNGGNGHTDPRGSQSLTPRLGGQEPSTNGPDGDSALAEEFEALLSRLRPTRPAA